MRQAVNVNLEDRSYDIHIDTDLLAKVGNLIPAEYLGKKTFILFDKNTYPYAQILEESLARQALEIHMYGMKGGEATKSYDGFQIALNWLLDNKVDRNSLLIVVGGGVIGDLGGFVASVVMRGIPFVQVPTTLLSQVDSSVGGKTGINTSQGKNLVGAFYQPKAVLCDISTLKALPAREVLAGYAEVVKYGLINKPDFFEWLEGHGQAVIDLDEKAIVHAVKTSCQAKADIVAADEHEKGQRALLNLGHTFGHALESSAAYDGRLLHGEAVAIGIVMAYDLSVRMGLCAVEDLEKVKSHFRLIGLKTSAEQISPPLKHSASELVGLMAGDKKAVDNKIGFILVRGIGQAFQDFNVDLALVEAVIEESLNK